MEGHTWGVLHESEEGKTEGSRAPEQDLGWRKEMLEHLLIRFKNLV